MKRGYVDVPEGQVHYRAEGSGDAIILLHMASSSSGEYSRVIPFLAKTYHAIAMDFLGFGESAPAPPAGLYISRAKLNTLILERELMGGERMNRESFDSREHK